MLGFTERPRAEIYVGNVLVLLRAAVGTKNAHVSAVNMHRITHNNIRAGGPLAGFEVCHTLVRAPTLGGF